MELFSDVIYSDMIVTVGSNIRFEELLKNILISVCRKDPWALLQLTKFRLEKHVPMLSVNNAILKQL